MGRLISMGIAHKNSKMKIALVIYGSLNTLSGGYLYDRMLVDYLKSQGDDVKVISIPNKSYHSNVADNWSKELIKMMNDPDIDLMLQDELNHPSLFHANKKIRGNYPIISIVHHLRSNEERGRVANWAYQKIEKAYLESVDGYIFNSNTTKDSVETLTNLDKPYVISSPGGDRFNTKITRDFVSSRVASSDRLNIIFIGNVIPRKQLMVLVEALGLIKSDLWHLDVVGKTDVDSRYFDNVITLVNNLSLRDRVTFSGALSDIELSERLNNSDLLVVPSSWEGFGIVYLEGMGFGLPAIATTEGAAKEIIQHGENGYLIDKGDSKALASHLQSLINHPQTLIDMSWKALDTYSGYPTWKDSAIKSRDFLIKVLEEN